ncbi:MAG: A/G-specific adenine glycosylase [Syntrophobacter sp.]
MRPAKDQVMGAFRDGLLLWFSRNRRALPWRGSYSPYEVWISEIMLQQTQVKTMLPYYSRWMKRFPDVLSIAEAREDEVLRCWEGLGYYARARNIHKAARVIASEFGGRMPRDFDSVRKLPGVGRYTAGAVMSIAYNEDYPAVDANVSRILARVFRICDSVESAQFKEAVWRHASDVLPGGRAREFNQALMDFGAMVCLPGEPSCEVCPISGICGAFAGGVAGKLPVRGRKKSVIPLVRSAGVLLSGGKVLARRRPESGLMPNLWEFPGGAAREDETPEAALRRVWHEELGIDLGPVRHLATVKHAHTSYRVTLHAYLCEADEALEYSENGSLRWVFPRELDTLAFPSAHRRIVEVLLQRLASASSDR